VRIPPLCLLPSSAWSDCGLIAVWFCSPKNERFWDTFETVSKQQKMAVFVCQNPSQNQSIKTLSVLGFENFPFSVSDSSSFPFA
jgi:hypothetical protein